MTLNELIIYGFIVELIILLVLFFALVGRRIFRRITLKRNSFQRQEISNAILEFMEGKSSVERLLDRCSPMRADLLLATLEEFDKRFKGADWGAIEGKLAEDQLLPKARKFATKWFWIKRNFSARCFALHPQVRDTEVILKLVDDPVFLVKSLASKAIIELADPQGVYKVIQHMSKEGGYAHYYYRDILLQGSRAVTEEVQKILFSDPNEQIKITCLDLLKETTMTLPQEKLKELLKTDNPQLKLDVIELFSNNHQADSIVVLLEALKDPNPLIRAEAARGLENFLTERTLQALKSALNDADWYVRLQAALTLKKAGEPGLAILRSQEASINPKGYEAAYYALHFRWV